MPVKSYTKVESRFRQAKEYMHDQLEEAIEDAVKAGEDTMKDRLRPGRGVDTGEYEAAIHSQAHGLEGSVTAPGVKTIPNPAWLEFGTVNAPPIPHFRTGARVMRKTFLTKLGRDTMKGFRQVKAGGKFGRRR